MKTSSKFPENNTEEEEQLLQKYALLKQLRKQLAELRSRQAAEAETHREKEETPIKTSEDARVAAERLVKLGKIKIQSACPPRVMMKKGRDSSGPASAYRPYSPTGAGSEDATGGQALQPPTKKPRANLYDSFVSGGVQDPGAAAVASASPSTPAPAGESSRPRGNTLFVQGYNIHQDMLRSAFSPFGPISRIAMETRGGRFGEVKPANIKPKAFVTFESEDDAANAMEQLDGQLVKGSVLSVRLARKQPTVGQQFRRGPPPPQLPGISDWTSPGDASNSRRRLGFGFASPDAPGAAAASDDDFPGSGSSPRYAPAPPPDQHPAVDTEEPSGSIGHSGALSGEEEQQSQQQQQQRRPLEYSDGVFVSSDPMEEDAVAELDEVM